MAHEMSETQALGGALSSRIATLGRQSAELGRFLKDDRCTRYFLLFLAVLNLSYVVSFLTWEQHGTFHSLYAGAFLLPAMMLAFQHRLREIADAAERRFWNLATVALAFWWVAALVYVVVPDAWWGMTADLITDCLYVLFYFSIFLAVRNRPNPAEALQVKLVRRLDSLGALVLVFGLLIYFVLVPSVFNHDEYETWLPSLYLYVALDVALFWQLAALSRRSASARWRSLYGALSVAFLLFAVTDLLECLTYAGILDWKPGAKTDLLWNAPILALVLAARLRHRECPAAPETSSLDGTWNHGTVGSGSLLLVAAFSFPMIHFSFYLLGLLDGATREPREVVVLTCLVVVGALAIAEDKVLRRLSAEVDAQRRHTEQLRMEKEVAERANDAKSEFLANMSHEIRTPMTGVLGVSDLLAGSHLSPPYDNYVRLLQSSAGSLLRIIDDILDFSKIEAGELTLESTPFSLRDALNPVLEIQSQAAAAKGIELRLTVSEELPDLVLGDPLRLRQVVLNLVANAVKFTAEGHVSIKVGPEGPSKRPAMIRFAVADTGIGIPPEALPRLFTPFSQADSSTTRKFGGTGLGLAICKRLVEAMGGRIGVESTPGPGSTFWFVIPLEPAEVRGAPVGAASADGPSALTGRRILLAEDNTINQLVATRQLQSLGYEVEVVGNGADALRALEEEDFDLILMDCQMPGIDGLETTRRIRSREPGDEHVPIIAVTAHAMPQDRDRCLAAGMDDYLAKPYVAQELASALRRWLSNAPRRAVNRPRGPTSPRGAGRRPPAA